jgi:hypothetical protein
MSHKNKPTKSLAYRLTIQKVLQKVLQPLNSARTNSMSHKNKPTKSLAYRLTIQFTLFIAEGKSIQTLKASPTRLIMSKESRSAYKLFPKSLATPASRVASYDLKKLNIYCLAIITSEGLKGIPSFDNYSALSHTPKMLQQELLLTVAELFTVIYDHRRASLRKSLSRSASLSGSNHTYINQVWRLYPYFRLSAACTTTPTTLTPLLLLCNPSRQKPYKSCLLEIFMHVGIHKDRSQL